MISSSWRWILSLVASATGIAARNAAAAGGAGVGCTAGSTRPRLHRPQCVAGRQCVSVSVERAVRGFDSKVELTPLPWTSGHQPHAGLEERTLSGWQRAQTWSRRPTCGQPVTKIGHGLHRFRQELRQAAERLVWISAVRVGRYLPHPPASCRTFAHRGLFAAERPTRHATTVNRSSSRFAGAEAVSFAARSCPHGASHFWPGSSPRSSLHHPPGRSRLLH